MTTGHVFIATSLDGFVARKDHQLDWLMKQNTANEEHGYEDFVAGVDGIVMGRGSFNTVLGFGDWPYKKPVVVMSRSLTSEDIPEHLRGKVSLSSDEPEEVMRSLEAKGWARAYIDGGRLVQSFIRAGLIKDFVITVAPILIGEGLPLFGELDADINLELTGSQSFPSGLLQTCYSLKTKT